MKWLAWTAFAIRIAAAVPLGMLVILIYPFGLDKGFRWLKHWMMEPLAEWDASCSSNAVR
jgi:hypothetical protein